MEEASQRKESDGNQEAELPVREQTAAAVDGGNRLLPSELGCYRIACMPPALLLLDMAKQSVKPPILRVVSDYLAYLNTPLVSLTLSRNSLGPEGARLLGKALVTNNSLQFLELEQCQLIGSPYRPQYDGVKGLAKGFESARSTLRYINVAGNCLQAEGCRILLVALSFHPTLTALSVADNSLTVFNDVSGVLALSYVITYAKRLCWLALDGNPFAGRPLSILRASLASNATLTALSAQHCELSAEQFRQLGSKSVLRQLQC